MSELIITSPFAGWVSGLEAVPDPVFAERMMGDGVALNPVEGVVRAPCDAEVVSVHHAGHAVTLRSAEGVELLIHVGLDTVALAGQGFVSCVRDGQTVKRGDPLLEFDLDAVALKARSLFTPVIVTNMDRFSVTRRSVERAAKAGDELMALAAVGGVGAGPESAPTGGDWREARVTLIAPHGLHARPAARLVECLKAMSAEARVERGEKQADGRSTVALLALGARKGDELVVRARGADADAVVEAMVGFLAGDMGDVAGEAGPAQPLPTVTGGGPLMEGEIAGVVASPGLAMGPAARLSRTQVQIVQAGRGVDIERAVLVKARDAVRDRISARSESGSGAVASVMRAHLTLLDDPQILAVAETLIAAGDSAGFAWSAAIAEQSVVLHDTGDARLIERIDDLKDIEGQVLAALDGRAADQRALPVGAVLIADDLLPSQLIALAGDPPAGVCLSHGGPTSHVAILCAGMGIPALVAMGEGLASIRDGDAVLVDAEAGRARGAPSEAEVAAFEARMIARRERREAARRAAAVTCRTRDGTAIEVFANIGTVEDAALAVSQGAEGSGLVRSEFLFLERDTPPSEDEQHAAYQAIATALDGRPVIIRLLDVGGDKPAPYIQIGHEENPALGQRGIRVGLAQPDILETQIRAILRVEPVGQCRIMIPMVSCVAEVRAVRAVVERAKANLGIATTMEVGVMVETPAAAMTADLLAAEADFLSVGTNDLTQYVLAMDRGNPAVASGVDALHPAVLRMIAETCRLAAIHGKWVGVCGGLASDPAAVAILIGLGVSELSSVPGFVPEAKQIVREITLADAQALAQQVLRCGSAAEVRARVRAFQEEAAR